MKVSESYEQIGYLFEINNSNSISSFFEVVLSFGVEDLMGTGFTMDVGNDNRPSFTNECTLTVILIGYTWLAIG